MKDKLKPILITSREAMQAQVAHVIDLRLQLAMLTTAMEHEKLTVEKLYQERLVDLARRIECSEAAAQVWSESHRADFGDKKSLDLVVAIVGFRTTPHRVEKRNSRDTWGKIARRLQALAWGESYIREPDPEVNKQALLTDRTKLSPQAQQEAGISFEQDEDFFIEPKSQVLEPSTREAA